ncbi:hypothetical protein A2Y99_02950 [Candidatus Gottesmanbacteria bacterium RBG_13_37_7]|uniref:Methyltransferase domain-containing protein n=1 Tax=Candidatus Gottesmanbacteria bacterium RBG_13_37_7 TaxID=1798369 RepID=A0A1F5YJL6_9BACT|nr:MAG: hypothetical protein A2Y99_02950 [Candidatus Gottesmanbacteria bacterium RBG_13_37_7]
MDQSKDTEELLKLHQNSYKFDYRRAALWHWLSKIIPKNAKVLDAGCGSGFIAFYLAERGNIVTALEYDPVLIKFIREKFRKSNLNIRIKKRILGESKKDIRLGKFDYVICLDVLEHIKNDLSVLKELSINLNNQGKIIISVPAVPSLYGKRDMALGHYRRYSKKKLHDLITEAGLSVIEIRYWNMLGAIMYMYYEKVLGRSISDKLRQSSEDNIISSLLRQIILSELVLEYRIRTPFGLTLLAICK